MDNSTVISSDNITSNSTSQLIVHTPYEIIEIVAPQIIFIDRIASPIWYILGLIGNPISAIIWLSRKIRKTNSSAVYFGSLAIVQTVYLLIHIVVELENAWGVNTYHRPGLCELFNFMFITPQYLAPMLVLGFTTERYIAVCHPFVKEKYCTVKRAKIVICCMASVSLAIGLVQMYVWVWREEMGGCVFRSQSFYIGWTWFTEMAIFGTIPVGCLIINVLVVVEIKRISIQSAAHGQNQSSSNAASTTTLLAVSFYFIFSLLPATIVYAMQAWITQGDPALAPLEAWRSDHVWTGYFNYLTTRKIVEELCLSNYAVYFIIYYTTGVYFRREVRTLLGIHKLRKRKSAKSMTSDYSLVTSNGKTMTETVLMDSPSES